jgi:uncharacterized protein with PIN domain
MLKERQIRFVADDMVGKLAKWLRILGHDVAYFRSIDNKELISIANSENRILLTRDTDIAESGKTRHCLFLESDNYVEQLRQVYRLLALKVDKELIFSRCLICNEKLKGIRKESVEGSVPPYVFETRDDFVICEKCNKVYWKGTHNERVEEILGKLSA